jgi:homopolymeric O-antigen transport system ATP-binding protein
MSVAISVQNISKLYRLGETNRNQLLADFHRWWTKRRRPRTANGNSRAESEPKEEGDFWALKDVSFDIEEGNTIGLIGVNGAGKSTLLKIISRITAPTKGKVRIKGRIGSLLEVGTGFHPELTGRDNVFLNGAILGMSRAEVKRKFNDIVAFAELEQFIDTPVKRYSSGMYVRLAFAVSAFLEPEILILDEVLAVGDIGFRTKCFKRLEELIAGRHTILFVAHDSGVVTKFCDSAIWLDKGVIKAFGPAENVADSYQVSQRPTKNEAPAAYEHGGTGEFVVSIGLLNRDGEAAHSLVCGEPCTITLQCERRLQLTESITKTMAKIAFFDEFGQRMFSLCSLYGERQLPALNNQTEILCEIPKLPLLPGTYRMNYEITVNGRCVDSQVAACNLEVVAGNYFGSRLLPARSATPICVDCNWRVNSVPSPVRD